jgi:hypothetical protein
MRTTVRLPEDLLARAKRKAAAEGRTLTSLIEEGLRTVLTKPGRPKKRARVVLPVSKATGGLRPGVDPVKINTQSEEIEDFERLHRIEQRQR